MSGLANGEKLPRDESVKKITKEEECKNIIRRSERISNRFKNLEKDNLVLKQPYKKKVKKSKLSGVFDNTLSKDIDNLETDKVEQNDGLQDLNGSKKLKSEENDHDDVKDYPDGAKEKNDKKDDHDDDEEEEEEREEEEKEKEEEEKKKLEENLAVLKSKIFKIINEM